MQESTLGSTRIGCPRTKLTDKAKLSQIVHQFHIIWLKSKEDPNYSTSLYKALNGIVSPTNAQRLRNEGVSRKMLIKTTNGKIRFRNGIAQPNEKMIISLIEESRNQICEPKPIAVVKQTTPIDELIELLPELRDLAKFSKAIKTLINTINHD